MMPLHRLRVLTALSLPLAFAPLVQPQAGPVEFGRSELNRAFALRGSKPQAIDVQLVAGSPESWSIRPGRITGADERGLLYGLLEAADQIRSSGRLTAASGQPATPMRGIRYFLHNHDLEEVWYYSREYWDQYFSMLARNRFNRFNLVFAHQTNYLAPPYPFWVTLPEFPAIRVPGQSDAQRDKNLETLCYISQTAADHGIDFALGIWQHNVQQNQVATVEGLTRENIGPYSRAALTRILEHCPAIRAVQLRTGGESGIPRGQQVEFYRDYIFPAIKSAGRILDLRGWIVAGGMVEAAKSVGVPIRLSTKYWAEDIGRPYQPAETFPNYSYLNFLEKPRPYQFYWEVWGLGSQRMLLWGSPDFVRRAVPTFRLSESIGFEIDAPPTQKGFGNRPGTWDVFTPAHRDRVFWKWDFERYWLFYLLWGRLSYDPKAPESVWIDELRRRFGGTAGAVLEAYRQASRFLPELTAAHLADPNMFIWPEINPGGLIDAYNEVPPSDWRYIASIPETVKNLRSNIPSAKQTAANTADLFDSIAVATERAVGRASTMLPADHREWNGSRPDFQVLVHLARYHAHKRRAALNVEWFDVTGHPAALQAAKQHLTAGVAEWEKLVEFTDGLYSSEMVYGPQDVGHWKDKLPYVRHDLELIREREEVFARFGRFDFGFDFGAPFDPRVPTTHLNHPWVRMNHVAPRFQLATRDSSYNDSTGFGWPRWGPRALSAIPLTPHLEVIAVAKRPALLPRNMLFGDFFRGDGGHHSW